MKPYKIIISLVLLVSFNKYSLTIKGKSCNETDNKYIVLNFLRGFNNDRLRLKNSLIDTTLFLTTEESSEYADAEIIYKSDDKLYIYLNYQLLDTVQLNFSCKILEFNKIGNNIKSEYFDHFRGYD